jgi:RimJ/RimL family protein N-acetyltransferase
MDLATWPLFGLRITTPTVTLRYTDDDDIQALADLALLGVHDPASMPFTYAWTDVEPPAQQRQSAQWYWRQRAEWTIDQWNLPFTVLVDGAVVGQQGAMADHYPALREVATGSWLGVAHQGRGIGKEMRAAVLHFAFVGLGAEYALSGAFHDNLASLGVSKALGYEEEGRRRALRREEPDWLIGLRLPRAVWERRRRDDITIEGLEPCLELFGIT